MITELWVLLDLLVPLVPKARKELPAKKAILGSLERVVPQGCRVLVATLAPEASLVPRAMMACRAGQVRL